MCDAIYLWCSWACVAAYTKLRVSIFRRVSRSRVICGCSARQLAASLRNKSDESAHIKRNISNNYVDKRDTYGVEHMFTTINACGKVLISVSVSKGEMYS